MKILEIHNYFRKEGGAENVMYGEASILKRNSHEVFFFSTDKQPYLDPSYEYTKYFPKYIPYFSLPKTQKLKYIFKPLYNIEAESKLNLLLQDIKPDIVHCHCISYQLTSSVINACYKNKIPIVMTVHDIRLVCPNGSLMINLEYYCKKERCISGNPVHCITNRCVNKNLSASTMAAAEFILNKINKIHDKISIFTFPSRSLLDFAKISGIKEEKLVLLNNFIDDSKRETIPEYTNKGYFLYVGRLTKEKGLFELLNAMAKLSEVNLHIVGTGAEEDNLKKLADKLKLNNVKFLGFKAGKELEEEYKYCIASILPSISYESFGLTILESFINGKPVIGSNTGGIPEVIDDNKNGLIVTPGIVNEMVNAIKRLYLDNNLNVKMGRNGREKAIRVYNAENHYLKLINIYNSLINTNER